MKNLLIIFTFIVLSLQAATAQYYNPSASGYTAPYYHNADPEGTGAMPGSGSSVVLINVNGLSVSADDLNDYGFYVINYYSMSYPPMPPTFTPVTYYLTETLGNIKVSSLSGVGNSSTAAFEESSDYPNFKQQSSIATQNKNGVAIGISLTVDNTDFSQGGAMVYWEAVIVNKKTGYCATTGLQTEYKEVSVNIVDPTLTPSTGPTITVEPIIAGCWSDGGTFDLTKAKKNVSDGATVEYYTDAEGVNKIDDPSQTAITITNPSSPTQVVKYYARAIDADKKSDIQEISVTFYQKPEVKLELADNMISPVCAGSKITLVAKNKNGFAENKFRFYCADKTLDEEVITPTTSWDINSFQTAGTYKVYAISARDMGECVDSAEIPLEVKPSISSGDIIIKVTAGKNPSCEGESVTLTASSAKPGATFIWQNPKGDGNINAASITVKPTADKEYTVKADLNDCPSADAKSHLIKVNPKPDINLTLLKPTCGVMVDLTQVVNSSSGLSYSYFADDGLTNEVPDPSQVNTGTYYIKGTDLTTTCYNSGAVTATVNPKPVPTIIVKDNVAAACSGSTVTLTAGPDDNIKTYDWGNGVTGKVITPVLVDGANSFSLTVTDNNNCEETVTDPVIITGKKVPTVNITSVNAACAGTEIALKADVTYHDGASAQSVVWTKGDATIANALETTAILGELANTYKVTVTDNNNCSGHDEITVNGNVLKVSLNAAPSGLVATGTSVNLTATASWNDTPTPDVDYSWKKILPIPEETLTESSKVLTVTPESNSTYQVQVSKEGCTATVNQEIEVLADPFQVGEISGGRALCAGDAFADAPMTLGLTVSGGQKDYTYVWTVPEGVTVSAKNAETLEITGIDYGQVSTGAEISVVVSDNTTPTPKSETRKYRLDITPIPEILINDKADGETLQACLGNELVLTARIAGVNGGSFVWEGKNDATSSTMNADVSKTGPKTYTVTGTNNQCSAKASVNVNVNALPELALNMQADGKEVTEVCPGTEVTLTASSSGITDASKYTWGGAALGLTGLTGTVTPTVAGSTPKYIVEVDNGTCKNVLEKTLTVHTPGTLTITPSETEVCGGSLVTLTPGGGQDYVWSGDVSDVTTDNPLEVTPDGTKTTYVYKLDGKDNNGCTAKQATQSIKVILSPVLVLAKTELSECVGATIDLRNAVNSDQSTSGATLWVSKGADAPTTITTVSEAGDYNIFLKSGTCQTDPQQVTVTFNALPDISVSIADNKTNPCSGEKITLQASSTDTDVTFIYAGNRGGTSWEVTPTDLTGTNPVVTYEVTAENAAKCTKVGTVSVTVKPLPDVDIVVPDVVCENSLVKLEATGATTYVWDDRELTTGKELKVTAAESNKVFTVTGTTDNCSNKKKVTLDLTPAPVLTLGTLADGCESAEMDLKNAVLSDGLTLTFYDQKEKPIAGSKVTIDTEGDYTYYVQGTDGDCPSKMESIHFTVKPKPVLEFTGNTTICEGETARIKVDGANTYTWQDGMKDNTNNPRDFILTETGTFKVEGIGSNGCTAKKEITINVNKKPVLAWDATTENIPPVVEGDQLIVQTILKVATTPEYYYSWIHNGAEADGVTTNSFRTTAGGESEEFAVTVTDGNNCVSAPLTKTVEVTPAGGVLSVTIASSSTTICQDGMQILTAKPAKGTPTYTYKWFKDDNLIAGEEGSELIVTEAAKYKVEVSDESSIPQTAFAEKEITIDATRPAPIVSVQNMTILSATAVNLFAEVNPAGGEYTYNWSPKEKLADGQENAVYPRTKPLSDDQDYKLYVTDDNGCISKTATGKVKIDAAAFKVIAEVNKNEICIGGKAVSNAKVLGTSTPAENDLTYSWTPADNLTGADQKNPVFTSQKAGEQEFFVMVSDKNGHVAGATVKVNVNTNETPVLALTAKDAVSCVGQRIEVTTEGIVKTYSWIIDGRAPIEGASSINTLGAGAHTVKVYGTDINGCPADTVEMDYFMNELPVIAWDDANEWSADQGTDVTIKAVADNGAAGDYTYKWSVAAAGSQNSDSYTLTNIQTHADFKVSVKDNTTGCSSKEIQNTVTVRALKPKIEFETNVTNGLLCSGGVAILDVVSVKGGAGTTNVFTDYTYEWYKGTDLVASTKDFMVNEVGVYTVKVKDVDGRVSDPKTITVALSNNSAPVAGNGTLTIAKGTQTYLYPNVTNGTPAYNYKWSPIDQLAAGVDDIENPQTTPLNEDVEYKYYVIDTKGCSSNYGTVAVTVVDPSAPELFAVTASADRKQICNGNTTTLRVATSRVLTNPVYEWSPASELDDPSSATPIFKPSVAADKRYTFTVKVTENGTTSATAQVNVIVKGNPAPVLSLQSEGDCDGQNVIVTNSDEAVPANGYTWIIDGVRDTKEKSNEYALSAGDARKVEVYATFANGCVSDTVADVFNRKALPELTWSTENGYNRVYEEVGATFTMKVVSVPADVTCGWSYTFTPKDGSAEAPVPGGSGMEMEVVDAKEGVYDFEVYAEKDGCQSIVAKKTVRVIPAGAVLDIEVSRNAATVCMNGTVKVFATGRNGDGNYSFKWYKGTTASTAPVAEGDTAYLSLTGTTERYVVEVTDGLGATKLSEVITLTMGTDLAPSVSDYIQCVASGNSTVLLSAVNDGAAPYQYQWSPEDKLATDEQGKAHPETQSLTQQQKYTYYVTDANGCVSAPGTVTVNVETASDALAIGASTNKNELCIGNTAQFNVVATQGKLSDAATYEWIPVDGLSEANVVNPLFTATVADVYEYVVKVTDGGKTLTSKVKVEVKDASAPTIDWDNTNPTSYAVGEPLVMRVTATDGAGSYTFHWLQPEKVDTEMAGMYSVPRTKEPKYTFEVYVTDANQCASSDTLKKDISAGNSVVPIEVEVNNKSCCAVAASGSEQVQLSADVTSGHTKVDYLWKGINNTIPLTNATTATVGMNVAGLAPGKYTFELKVTDQEHTDNTKTIEATLTINALPVASINKDTVVCYKKDPFRLYVENSSNNTYLWGESVYDMSISNWGDSKTKGQSSNLIGTMSDNDLRYVVTVIDKNMCQAKDTAYVLRIPDAPVLAIDTNTNHLNIKLQWGKVNGADEYTVWSRKWDPYCINAADGGKYVKEDSTTSLMWAEPSMDTLEFYYVTATRKIGDTKYHSVVGDTVGYYLFDVRRNTGKMASINYYPVYFEMKGASANGAYRTKDMFALYGNAITLIKKWNFSTQLWEAAQKLPNGVIANDFDIEVGTLLQLDPKGQTRILQYGVLPNGLSALLARTNTGSKANISHSYMWTHRLDLTDTKDFLTEFTGVSLIKYWDFSSQLWVASQRLPNGVIAKTFDLKGLMPLQIELKSGVTSVDWK